VAALEPHFAQRLCEVAGVKVQDLGELIKPKTHAAIAAFLLTQSRRQLDALAAEKDIPMHTLGK
jgi:alpha-methylacyl-CoA racemase